jgi:hypothetical protein
MKASYNLNLDIYDALDRIQAAQGETHPGWNDEYLNAKWVREQVGIVDKAIKREDKSMSYTSMQRWLYTEGETLPIALRRLADKIETFKCPDDEFPNELGASIIEIHQSDDETATDFFRTGICLSFKPSKCA